MVLEFLNLPLFPLIEYASVSAIWIDAKFYAIDTK